MILKDEIKTIVRRVLNREMWPDYATNQILALIEGERCQWTKQIEDNHEYYTTSCDLVDLAYHTYCPKCGKRIEVKGE